MLSSLVTIVVLPRERFSTIERCIESIYRCTPRPFTLICVDGNYPSPLKQRLQILSKVCNFQVLHFNSFLYYSQGRRLVVPFLTTPYTCFVDNDVIVTPGWLDRMLICAQENGAGIVPPVILEGEIEQGIIHSAGGIAVLERKEDGVFMHAHQFYYHNRLAEVRSSLQRGACTLAEPHTFLIRTDLLKQVIDEQILCCTDYVSISLDTTMAGYSIYLEPESIVSYLAPPPFEYCDLPFFRYIWSREAVEKTLERLREKYDLNPNDPWLDCKRQWMINHLNHSFRSENILPSPALI